MKEVILPEYMSNRHNEESEGFFCRFTFGQFFALLVLEVLTIFFVFYLGARYGRGLLGLDRAPAITMEESATQGINPSDAENTRVATTADPEVAKMAGELVAKAETPELKDRIRKMIDEAQGPKQDKMPEVVAVNRPDTPEQRKVPEPPVVTTVPDEEKLAQDSEEFAANKPEKEKAAEEKTAPADTGVIRVKSAENARYSVQTGSYPNATEAKNAVERLKGKGYPAYLMIADIPDRGRWYRVRIGGFSTRDEAAKYLKDFSTKENTEALVVMNEQ